LKGRAHGTRHVTRRDPEKGKGGVKVRAETFCVSSLLRKNHSTLQRVLHTALFFTTPTTDKKTFYTPFKTPPLYVSRVTEFRGASVACQRRRKAILSVRSRDGNLPLGRIATLRGTCRSRAPRRGTRDLDIDSRLVKAVFIRIWTRSCIDRPPSPPPSRCTPRRSARHAARPTREHGGRARSSPTQTAY
jgi:hypothetical protein